MQQILRTLRVDCCLCLELLRSGNYFVMDSCCHAICRICLSKADTSDVGEAFSCPFCKTENARYVEYM
jgi:hypothetical protein